MMLSESTKLKLIIFDLDGVLVDSRELHYEALNRALEEIDPKYIINREEHLSTYDGRPTTAKLNMLTEAKGLPREKHDQVWRAKQEKTFEVIADTFKFDGRLRLVLSNLKKKGYLLYCASNSIFKTLQLMLLHKGLLEYFDFILSCEDPAPDVYVACCLRANVCPSEVMIVEDSHVGRKAALRSGCHLCPVENPENVTSETLNLRIDHMYPLALNHSNMTMAKPSKTMVENINIVVPMAADYDDFKTNGFNYPAPLVEVNGRPMAKMVVENLGNIPGHYNFVVNQSDYEEFNLKYFFPAITTDCNIITAKSATKGQAMSVLLAKNVINNDSPLLIVNCHQYIDWDCNEFIRFCKETAADGVIPIFENLHPRYSYVGVNSQGVIDQVAEKDSISNHASCGVYYWKRGSDFVKYAEQMIAAGKSVNGNFYASLAFNEAIKDGKEILPFQCAKMWSLNNPKDLESFYTCQKVKDMK